MKLLTQCPHCKKHLTDGEIIERWCNDCREPTKTSETRQVRKEAA